uniref:Col_cuticle_N domain-containing protein n=1 Tax=Caenorhabditis tropicalis TaxID=1561998 RepID=A0A1I7TIE1_9PELO
MANMMHPALPIGSVLLWFAIVLGVLLLVALFGCLFLIVIDPFIQRRRVAYAERVAARFNRDNDTAVLLSRCLDGGYP